MSFERLATEARNPDTHNIDLLTTYELVTVIQREDAKVAAAVKLALPQIEAAVEEVTEALCHGGRLFYIGAGTSGRLGVLDAAECPPTFNTPPELVQALIAGGPGAMFQAVEGAEDDVTLGGRDLQERSLIAGDVVIGLAASGRTPYVIGALRYAAALGCRTIAVVCVPESELSHIANITIAAEVGPEVISGSTRMKAGTAQKMILNMISTAAMIKMGKTYGNLMVDVRATNAKLAARVIRMVKETTGASEPEAVTVVKVAGGSAKVAIVALLGKLSVAEAEHLLAQSHGSVRHALEFARNNIREG